MMNSFEKRIQQMHDEREAGLSKPDFYGPGSYFDRIRAIRRKQRKAIAKAHVVVQTYRVNVELECGHRWSFTLSNQAHARGTWKTRRIECHYCAEEALKKAQIDPV